MPSEDLDQPVHSCSLIRIFRVLLQRIQSFFGSSNWYWLTDGQGLLSLQQVRVEGEYCIFFCSFTFCHFPLSSLSFSVISSTVSSISFLPFSGRRHKVTHKGWRFVKPHHNQKFFMRTTKDSDRTVRMRRLNCSHVAPEKERERERERETEGIITKTCLFKYNEYFITKKWKFSEKNADIFHISAQNIDCGYSLEPPRRGGSNEYPQSMFWSEIRKNIYTPVNPSFTI